jgi:hypothetical protein
MFKDFGLIMNFSNDNTMSVTQKNENCEIKKIVKVMSK